MSLVGNNVLLVRVDSGINLGSGHVMRCLALAQAWQDGVGDVVFVLATESPNAEAKLTAEGFEALHINAKPGSAEDARLTTKLAHKYGASWVVVDGYHFGGDYQKIIKEAGLNLLFIDDYGHADYYPADIVLNQNIHADEDLYRNRASYTKLLLGTRYVLLRREFLRWQGYRREIPEIARKMLVTMGGSDPQNVTLKVLQALKNIDIDGFEAVCVVGGSNPHYDALKDFVETANLPVRIERDVKDMSQLMAWADVAITAGGTTCWELAFMGVPFVIVVLAENQQPVADSLDNIGCALNLEWPCNLPSFRVSESLMRLMRGQRWRAEMSQCGQGMVDGKGVFRVLSSAGFKALNLRPAYKEDCRLLWEWANDAVVRNYSFNSDPIPWEEHVKWFNERLNDPNCLIFIAEDADGTPVGQIRFEVTGERAEVSVSVDKSKRNLGYGTLLIEQGVKEVFRSMIIKSVHAFIKPDNIGSIRSFERSGFRYVGLYSIKGYNAEHYVLVRKKGFSKSHCFGYKTE